MRYRRVTYSYAEVLHPGGARPGGSWIERSLFGMGSRAFRPAADLLETEDAFVACVELAGLDEERLTVTLYADELVLEGVRSVHRRWPPARFHLAEIRDGPFRLALPLPPGVARDRITVEYEAGLVVVRMPVLGRAEEPIDHEADEAEGGVGGP